MAIELHPYSNILWYAKRYGGKKRNVEWECQRGNSHTGGMVLTSEEKGAIERR